MKGIRLDLMEREVIELEKLSKILERIKENEEEITRTRSKQFHKGILVNYDYYSFRDWWFYIIYLKWKIIYRFGTLEEQKQKV